jgi:hypothetical protein
MPHLPPLWGVEVEGEHACTVSVAIAEYEGGVVYAKVY